MPEYYVMVSSTTKNIIHAGIIYHHCMLVIRTIHHNPYNLVLWILDTLHSSDLCTIMVQYPTFDFGIMNINNPPKIIKKTGLF